jgi:hypothetical protein
VALSLHLCKHLEQLWHFQWGIPGGTLDPSIHTRVLHKFTCRAVILHAKQDCESSLISGFIPISDACPYSQAPPLVSLRMID